MSKARLLEAVHGLDLGSARELLRARPSLIATIDRQGRNLLQLACCVSSIAAQRWSWHPVEDSLPQAGGMTRKIWSCCFERAPGSTWSSASRVEEQFDSALLKWLVAHGASPDVGDREGISPRMMAARKRDKRFLAALS